MRNRYLLTRKARNEGGYALLLVSFMTAVLIIATLSTGLYVKTEAKREKEEEMIWRGKQYVRGIKLYVRKNSGRFPTSLDDLTKPSIGNIYFMRQAYKDPMNKEDGSWRLLYVGANGQLIGSLKPTNVQLSFGGQSASANLQPGTPGPGTAGVGIPGVASNTSGFGSSSFGQSSSTASGTGTASTGTNGSNGANPQGTGTDASGTGDTGSSSNPQPIAPTDTPTIIGGKVIGIGSKIDQKSIKVYEMAKNYRLFEFYWDPAKEAQAALQGAAVQSGPGNGSPAGTNGQNPFSQTPPNPASGQGVGGQPTQQGPSGPPQ